MGQLHGFHRVGHDNDSEADCPHAQSVPVSGVLLRYGHGAVLICKAGIERVLRKQGGDTVGML